MIQPQPISTKDYQKGLFERLSNHFEIIENEWRAFAFGDKHTYAPRVDIAVGPFNDETAARNLTSVYNRLVGDRRIRALLKKVYDFHVQNLDQTLYTEVHHPDFERVLRKNQNARCLLAIEIEYRNSRKHIMGSIVNAAALGRVGIGIAYSEKSFKAFLRIVNYLSFLRNVGKNGYDTVNFLVLNVDQMNSIVAELDEGL